MASGSRVRVEITYENDILPHNDREVISINMSSRTLSGEESHKRHQEFAAKIRNLPDQLVMKKMDTGFRGNATFEMEGIMKGLGMEVCFVLDHSPSRNTFTLYGNQYVEGVILPKSVFGKEDPLKRQQSAYIPDILAKDATLPVGLVDIDTVKGNRLLEDVLDATEKGFQILVFDVTGDADCSKIIRTLAPHYANALWAGSNGLGWGLADYLYGKPKRSHLHAQERFAMCMFYRIGLQRSQKTDSRSTKKGIIRSDPGYGQSRYREITRRLARQSGTA